MCRLDVALVFLVLYIVRGDVQVELPEDLNNVIYPYNATQTVNNTASGAERDEDAGYLFDEDRSTGPNVSATESITSMELMFNKTYTIYGLVIFHNFYTDWYDANASFIHDQESYREYKTKTNNVNIFVYQDNTMVELCSKLNLSTDLNQSSQTYNISCDFAEGNTLYFTKPNGTGGIAIWEIVTRGFETSTATKADYSFATWILVGALVMALGGWLTYAVYTHFRQDSGRRVQQDVGKRGVLFLLHDWKQENSNRKKLAFIQDELKKRGYRTCTGNLNYGIACDKSFEQIQHSMLILVFVTRTFCDKLLSGNPKDQCKYEYAYAKEHKGNSHMIPVVIEAEMKDRFSWAGALGVDMDCQYADFSGSNEEILATWHSLEQLIAAKIPVL